MQSCMIFQVIKDELEAYNVGSGIMARKDTPGQLCVPVEEFLV